MVAPSHKEPTKCCVYGCFQVLPVSAFGTHPRTADGLSGRCKACESDRLALRKHGITAAQKAEIASTQDGCAICGRLDPGGKGWVVDHDRSCCSGDKSCPDCRRGILCQWCNTALGYAQDNPTVLRRMADYLASQVRLANATPDPDSIRTDGQNGLTKTPTQTAESVRFLQRAGAYKQTTTRDAG